MAMSSSNSQLSELQNGSPEPESPTEAAAADADPQLPDAKETDVLPEAEQSGKAQPVNAEALGSAPEAEISNESTDVESRAVQSSQDAERDLKLGKEDGNRTFTMRELLNELKNGDANNNDGREVDNPHS